MANTSQKLAGRRRRKKSIRKRVQGTAERPRLTVFRSSKHIYAQLVDDDAGHTLASASSLKVEFTDGANGGNREGAVAVGKEIAERGKAAGVSRVVFDRNGFLYHGRLAALADAAREGGLDF